VVTNLVSELLSVPKNHEVISRMLSPKETDHRLYRLRFLFGGRAERILASAWRVLSSPPKSISEVFGLHPNSAIVNAVNFQFANLFWVDDGHDCWNCLANETLEVHKLPLAVDSRSH
jgi:hypothetical protein